MQLPRREGCCDRTVVLSDPTPHPLPPTDPKTDTAGPGKPAVRIVQGVRCGSRPPPCPAPVLLRASGSPMVRKTAPHNPDCVTKGRGSGSESRARGVAAAAARTIRPGSIVAAGRGGAGTAGTWGSEAVWFDTGFQKMPCERRCLANVPDRLGLVAAFGPSARPSGFRRTAARLGPSNHPAATLGVAAAGRRCCWASPGGVGGRRDGRDAPRTSAQINNKSGDEHGYDGAEVADDDSHHVAAETSTPAALLLLLLFFTPSFAVFCDVASRFVACAFRDENCRFRGKSYRQ